MAEEEKTERATPRRREDLRRRGQVARSPEVLTAFVLGAGLLGLWVGAANLYSELGALAQHFMGRASEIAVTQDAAPTLAVQALGPLVRGLAPLLLAALVGGIAGNVVQVGFLVSGEALTPDPNRLNPVSGFGNLFQKTKLVDLVKSVLKVVMVAWVAYVTLKGRLTDLPYLADLPPRSLLVFMLELGFQILKNVLLAYVAVALLDYAFQRWQFEERNKMSKQEVKDEFKETEGDPLIKSRIRALQREMARRRMMAEVPTSDVVVTNPTHFAVALRYEAGAMAAPEVVAKGADRVALKIIELAREHGVPLYQDPPIARALHRQVELGETIPAEMFQAVAEILAHVYRLAERAPTS